jgi:hypothetical protein
VAALVKIINERITILKNELISEEKISDETLNDSKI